MYLPCFLLLGLLPQLSATTCGAHCSPRMSALEVQDWLAKNGFGCLHALEGIDGAELFSFELSVLIDKVGTEGYPLHARVHARQLSECQAGTLNDSKARKIASVRM